MKRFILFAAIIIAAFSFNFRDKAKKISLSTGLTNIKTMSCTGKTLYTPGLSLSLTF